MGHFTSVGAHGSCVLTGYKKRRQRSGGDRGKLDSLPSGVGGGGASCRIRTNDPEITNHVLWPTELKRQVGKLSTSHMLNPLPLLRSRPGEFAGSSSRGTYPGAKVQPFFDPAKNFNLFYVFGGVNWPVRNYEIIRFKAWIGEMNLIFHVVFIDLYVEFSRYPHHVVKISTFWDILPYGSH